MERSLRSITREREVFSADTEYKKLYRIGENVTTEELVLRARAYWAWSV